MRGAWTWAVLLLLVGLAGCISEETDAGLDPAQAEATGEEADISTLGLEGEDCEMGGGQSVHPREIPGWNVSGLVPDPWRVADVIEDTGERFVYSQIPDPTQPKPEEGDTWGHYHSSLVCETWRLDGETRELSFGFVGPKVASPAFAEEGADDTYLATVVATDDEELYERLQRGGIDAMHADIDFERLGSQADIVMDTDHNGDYRSTYRLAEFGPLEDEHVRLWFQHENVDGTYAPIGLEIEREGGTHYGAEGEGYFHHQGTAHHWPLPGAYGHTAAVHYDGFDVSLAWGPTPDVTHEERYHH